MDDKKCCDYMQEHAQDSCNRQCNCANVFSCPDSVVYYSNVLNEYGLIIHDGSGSYIVINYCPWCGTKLPDSERNNWFDQLEKMGYDSPLTQEIPSKFKSDDWRAKQQ